MCVSVASSVRPESFSNCKGPCTSGPLPQTWHGTNRVNLQEEVSMGLGCEGDRVWTYYGDEIG